MCLRSPSLVPNKDIIYFYLEELLCRVALCILKLSLDLEIFPHKLHGCSMPVIWLASMWLLMWCTSPSFPHILQIFVLPWPFLEIEFSLKSIMELICSSNCWKSTSNFCSFTERSILVLGNTGIRGWTLIGERQSQGKEVFTACLLVG